VQAQPCGHAGYCYECFDRESAKGPRYATNCPRCAGALDHVTYRPHPGNCIVCRRPITDDAAAAAWINKECGCIVACSARCAERLAWETPCCPMCSALGAPEFVPLAAGERTASQPSATGRPDSDMEWDVSELAEEWGDF